MDLIPKYAGSCSLGLFSILSLNVTFLGSLDRVDFEKIYKYAKKKSSLLASQNTMENSKRHDMTKGSIFKHLWRMALPVSVGLFFNTMYNVVDTFFLARESTESLAAISLSFPIFLGLIAVTEGISTAASALISYHVGKKDEAMLHKLSIQIFTFSLLTTFFLMCSGWYFTEPVFRFLGADGMYLHKALAYMNTILYGSAFFAFSSAINGILLAQGQPHPMRNVLVAGFFLNCFLDPWFLYGGFGLPAMGIRGIAYATLLSKSLGLVYLFWKAWIEHFIVRVKLKDYFPQWKILKQILTRSPSAHWLLSS